MRMNIKSNPRVSIIIPCFNGEKYLEQAINSAIRQTYENIEVIVVNDGSSDRTEEIAMSYSDRIRYFKKENGGVSSALNLGISKMTGEYFSWLSHDDMYLPQKVEMQIKAVEERGEECKFLYSNFTCLIENDGTYQKMIPARRLYGNLCERSLFPVLFNLINGCTVLIHKSLFEQYGLFNEGLLTSQDYDMWKRLLNECDPVYLDDSLVVTRVHDRQGSKTIREFSDNSQKQQIEMARELTEKKKLSASGGMYKFYADMIELSVRNEWDSCVDFFFSAFENIDAQYECAITKNIYVYGAGVNGRRVLEECRIKNVDVMAVIDRRDELWGQKICGVECKSLSDIPGSSEIWIAVEDDVGIKRELIERGFTNVKDFSETNVYLFDIIPSKERIAELVCSYKQRREMI